MLRASAMVAGWTGPATPPLDFAVQAGEIVGLTGPNGVGKSTVLAAFAGRAAVFSGALELRPGLRLAVQTQDPPPVDGLPLCGRELLGLTEADPAGLPPWLAGKLDCRLDRLSGGQRHYLALWAVLHAPADLVLLDEPTNNLDTGGIRHLTTHLRERAAEGCGIVVVSHDAAFIAAVCDRAVNLEADDAA